jgi:FixJ family two-component response regulator
MSTVMPVLPPASLAEGNTRIAVVDDDPNVLRSLGRLLCARGFDARTYASAPALMAEVAALRPSCIIADLYMPELSGLELQQELASAGLQFPLVFITGRGDIRATVLAMRRGAVDFLAKPFGDDELLAAVERALECDRVLRAASALGTALSQRVASLTHRERHVFTAVVEGLRNKQIAAKLGITEKTVKIHRARVMQKMAVRSVAQLARIAERLCVSSGQATGKLDIRDLTTYR